MIVFSFSEKIIYAQFRNFGNIQEENKPLVILYPMTDC